MTPTTDSKAAAPTRRRWAKTRFVARWVRRLAKGIACLLLLVVIAAVVWIAWTNHRGPLEVAQVSQTIVDRGISIDRPATVPEAENGARYYLAPGHALIIDETLINATPGFGSVEWPLFSERINNEQTDLLQQVLAPHQSAFDLARRARDFGQFQYNIDDVFAMQNASDTWGRLRPLARFLTLRMYLAVAEGDNSAAVESIRDQIHLARSVQPDEGISFNLAVRVAATAIANGNVEDLLARTQLDESDLLALADDLQNLIEPDRFWAVSTHPAKLFAWHMADAQSTQMLIDMGEINANYIAWMWQKAFEINDEDLKLSWFETWTDRLLDVRLAINPGAFQIGAAQEMEVYLELLDEIKAGRTIDEDRIDQLRDEGYELVAGLPIQQRLDVDLQAQLMTTIYGLAAERYRVQHGEWPTDWDQIRPGQIIPVDPWGQPLRLVKTEEGFRVYSLGRNGIDDGGSHRWDDDADYEVDDFNIRLLDPEHRGKPTTPIPLFAEESPSISGTLEELSDTLNESFGMSAEEDTD